MLCRENFIKVSHSRKRFENVLKYQEEPTPPKACLDPGPVGSAEGSFGRQNSFTLSWGGGLCEVQGCTHICARAHTNAASSLCFIGEAPSVCQP